MVILEFLLPSCLRLLKSTSNPSPLPAASNSFTTLNPLASHHLHCHSPISNHHHPSSLAWITSKPPNWSPYLQTCLSQIHIVFPRDFLQCESDHGVPHLTTGFPVTSTWLLLPQGHHACCSFCLNVPLKPPPHTWLTCPSCVSLDITSSGGLCSASLSRVGSPCSCSQVPCGSAHTLITHSPFCLSHQHASSLCVCLAHSRPSIYIC